MNPPTDLCPVWISRHGWPWPKKYLCKGMYWGTEVRELPNEILVLVLADERKVFIHAAGRIITYGRRAYEWSVEQMAKETGQRQTAHIAQ